jgi:hypothetical protein
MKEEGLVSCVTIIKVSRRNSLEFIIEYVLFIRADNQDGFLGVVYSGFALQKHKCRHPRCVTE